MTERLISYLESHLPDCKQVKYLLAVSGGIDSTVMAHLFTRAGLNFAIAHCNFGLRGDDSVKDEEFAMALAETMEVPFYREHFATEEEASRSGKSIQMVARGLRYDWFEKVRTEAGYSYVATAHHLNDSFETAILNLTKGTGFAGIRSIPFQRDAIIRPLLFATKEEIESYAKKQGIKWREDVSNQSDHYQRNLIRNNVVPALEEINPNLAQTWAVTSNRLAGIETWLMTKVAEVRRDFVDEQDGNTFIAKSILQELGAEIILFELLKEFGFSWHQTLDIIEAASTSGKIFITTDYVLNVDRSAFIISKGDDATIVEIQIEKGDKLIENSDLILECGMLDSIAGLELDQSVAALDYDNLSFPMTVRKWQEGDRFYPLGMDHKKKLSDFMIDVKIPVNLKKGVLVITSDDNIVWVVGYRVDNRFKATKTSKKVFLIKQIRNDKSI